MRRFEKQMIVVVHEAIGVTELAIPIDHMGEQGQPRGAITVIRDHVLAGIAPTRDVGRRPPEIQAAVDVPWRGSVTLTMCDCKTWTSQAFADTFG